MTQAEPCGSVGSGIAFQDLAEGQRDMIRPPVLLAVVMLCAELAAAGPIYAEAHGSSSPTPSFTAPLQNGDFAIDTLYGLPVGEGEDDWTSWTFDLASHPSFAGFPTSAPLATAKLTLTLTVGDVWIMSDEVSLGGLPPVITPTIQTLPVGVTSTVTLDLLEHYSSAAILGVVEASAGQVPVLYHDDATVSYARLDLESVPEPSSLLLVLVGIAVLARMRRVR
jgi:hypothetical protein